MTGRKQEFNIQILQLCDAVLLAFAFWGAYVLREQGAHWFAWEAIGTFDENRWMVYIIIPFGTIFLEVQDFYTYAARKGVRQSLQQMAAAAFWLALIIGGCVIFFRLKVPSRSVLILFGVLAPLLLLAREGLTTALYRRRLRRGANREPVLLVGPPEELARLRGTLTPEQEMEMDIVGEFDLDAHPLPVLIDALHRHAVNRVILTGGGSTSMALLQRAIAACETEGVEAWLVADFIKTAIAKPSFDAMGSVPMLVFRTTPGISWALLVKAVMDRTGALLLLLLSSPLWLVAFVGIRFSSPGPVIFSQKRAGKHGRPFTMYKFRSMRVGAEAQQAGLQAKNEMSGPVFKIENDPRVTPFGRWLRRTSVDELPQLLNVLAGQMSLVGPRPLPLYEVDSFENTAQRRRLSVKPGLTCLWQISGRSNVQDFEQWVRLDLDYIDNWSLWLDVKILVKTIPVVLFGLGAR